MDRAMERIEAALARIERAGDAPRDGELAARHAALRNRVSTALGGLDALLAEMAP